MGPRRSTFADGGLETLSTGDKAWLHKGLRAWPRAWLVLGLNCLRGLRGSWPLSGPLCGVVCAGEGEDKV